jgi:hypothetical protein
MKTPSHALAGVVLLAVALLVSVLPLPARAAQSYDNCAGFIDTLPATISTQGVWCLRHDLSTAMTSGAAITVTTNNVTIDCNDFKLGGLAAGVGTNARGISAVSRFNLTVRHCNIRGFLHGLIADGGGGHLAERNGFDANTSIAIQVFGAGSMVRGNRVIDTGGSTSVTGFAYGIYVADGVDVLDNTVNGVAATPNGSSNASAFGIVTSINGEGSIAGNRVRGLAASGTGTTYGIYNGDSGRVVVRDNDVQGAGVANSIGVRCTGNQSTARDNVIAGFATGIDSCLSSGNTVNPN